MTIAEFLDKQFHLSVSIGMNQRYHQYSCHFWERWDRGVKIVVGLLAVVGAVQAFASPPGDPWALFVACAGAASAIALNVIPLSEWACRHRSFLQQWSDLREDIDGLPYQLKEKPTASQVDTLRSIEAKFNRISGSEPAPNHRLIKLYFKEECQSRLEGPIGRALAAEKAQAEQPTPCATSATAPTPAAT